MYGASSKLGGGGRGSGRGGSVGRRSSPYPPPPHRLSNSSSSRLSLGGGSSSSSNPRNRSGPPSAAVEETFSLVPGNKPPVFAMIIRLAPDLVDEIKKVEAQGRSARIKFDPIATNEDGNVIDVGGKEFRFTWSKEVGEPCDIYEERRSGEDGNGLLVETGCSWRKVNVQRVLDESTTNQVKMRSEEAERKNKARKAIVLDHGNPSMKSQWKQMQAAESTPWRMQFKHKKEPPYKKRKSEPLQVGGPNKSTVKSVKASTTAAKGRHSSSPIPSPSEQIGPATSPIRSGSFARVHMEDAKSTPMKSQENPTESQKDITLKSCSAVQETSVRNNEFRAKSMDLQSSLISLLTEKPGMSLKALEKAIGDTTPNAAKKIEPILRKIANYQSPGKYVLKTGVGMENSNRFSFESRSSPEDNHVQKLDLPKDHVQRPASEPRFADKSPTGERQQPEEFTNKIVEQSNASEKIDIEQHSPDLFGNKKVSDNSEGQAGSSSASGSDSSRSDSSGSDSDGGSHSRSRSRTPARTGSSSSSDSESDASSNSKEGSDEDVDIMSDDDKDLKHTLQASDSVLRASPDPWKSVHNGADEKQDGDGSDAVDIEGHGSDAAIDIEGHGSDEVDIEAHEPDAVDSNTRESDAVDIEKHLDDGEQELKMTANDALVFGGENPTQNSNSFPSDHHDRQAFIGHLFEDNDNDRFRHEQSDISKNISQGKSKRHSKKNYGQKPDRRKRLKPEGYSQGPISDGKDAQLAVSLNDRQTEDLYKGNEVPDVHKVEKEGNADFDSQKGYGQSFSAKPNLDFHTSGQMSSDQSERAPDISGRFKHLDRQGYNNKFHEKDSPLQSGFPVQREKGSRDTQNEDDLTKEKRMPRNPKEGSGRRHSAPFASQYRKQGEIAGKPNELAQVSGSRMVSSPKDCNRVDITVTERSLQREPSDLELGELREPLMEDAPAEKQIERKGSFKLSESRTSIPDNSNLDLRKQKSFGRTPMDLKKPSPTVGDGVKRTSEHLFDDSTRSHKAAQLLPKQMSRTDDNEIGSQFGKSADISNRLRQDDTGAGVGNSLEGYGESHKKLPVNTQQMYNSKREPSSQLSRERKMQISNAKVALLDGEKDISLTDGNKKARRRKEFSSVEEETSYYKYEKEAPDLKGPIRDFSQYKEYVQEYRDKYDSYCSLNKILETYRDEFQKLGNDLESAKGRDADKYSKTLTKLMESYRRCGARHKRLKKIFVVLHEELTVIKQMIKDYARSIID